MATVPGAASRNAETSGAEPVIEARGLRMRYGSTDVLHGLDIRANRGEVLALLGPNGAGKTTTIEILEGFRKRSAGELLDHLGRYYAPYSTPERSRPYDADELVSLPRKQILPSGYRNDTPVFIVAGVP